MGCSACTVQRARRRPPTAAAAVHRYAADAAAPSGRPTSGGPSSRQRRQAPVSSADTTTAAVQLAVGRRLAGQRAAHAPAASARKQVVQALHWISHQLLALAACRRCCMLLPQRLIRRSGGCIRKLPASCTGACCRGRAGRGRSLRQRLQRPRAAYTARAGAACTRGCRAAWPPGTCDGWQGQQVLPELRLRAACRLRRDLAAPQLRRLQGAAGGQLPATKPSRGCQLRLQHLGCCQQRAAAAIQEPLQPVVGQLQVQAGSFAAAAASAAAARSAPRLQLLPGAGQQGTHECASPGRLQHGRGSERW